ncbi:TetR/AcrR family transcriptional regulator [Micromonospora tulbaghiae]|uniref:TetR/AcrR family transcriptional regulator n=1 Tax=Micromonospora tulbaghiae TaxID=479978 RepID=A0AAW4JIT3_9ACTN|nr:MULTISPECIES: TetR/AcrR family transcriptional regulator [Micromonospora]KAB1910216.1 TetR/AcrR family transcriptional regulator [Micromonospora sp. AMSO1212t]MBO4138661.1 TetR/AcrR family transcriptional regulator [Micromonospora tulbaghiae]MDX5458298.1 TetR/AcrR family transcriptional regulator [Micromonospora tulbaghiae]SCE75085.1 transcriptional regulator, TetR family [Micromonospora tulbaghiae]
MPKIQASTVAEHRAAQRAALLDAARTLLSEHPEEIPSLADVARHAGLARSSAYSYFKSRTDMFDVLVADTFPRWSAFVEKQMAEARTPGARILAYVEANLQLVARGDHALARALASVGNSEVLATSSRLLHDSLEAPLRAALTEHGASDPDRMAELVQSVVYALSRMIENGLDLPAARGLARELLTPYLRSDAG